MQDGEWPAQVQCCWWRQTFSTCTGGCWNRMCMCSERRRVQEEMAVFVDLYEWRGSYTLQGFRPLLLPLLSYGRAVRSCTAAGILPTSAQLQPASDRRREATLSLWLHRFPPLPLPLSSSSSSSHFRPVTCVLRTTSVQPAAVPFVQHHPEGVRRQQ